MSLDKYCRKCGHIKNNKHTCNSINNPPIRRCLHTIAIDMLKALNQPLVFTRLFAKVNVNATLGRRLLMKLVDGGLVDYRPRGERFVFRITGEGVAMRKQWSNTIAEIQEVIY